MKHPSDTSQFSLDLHCSRRSPRFCTSAGGSSVFVEERIGSPLDTDRAGRSMTADEGDVIAEGKELGPDGVDQSRVVAAWQVSSSDRAAEQHVADDSKLPR